MRLVAWGTFIVTVLLAIDTYDCLAFDQAARNIAATNETHLRNLDESATALGSRPMHSLNPLAKALRAPQSISNDNGNQQLVH